jgi:hypothetical protein
MNTVGCATVLMPGLGRVAQTLGVCLLSVHNHGYHQTTSDKHSFGLTLGNSYHRKSRSCIVFPSWIRRYQDSMDLDNTFLASMWNNITHIITPSSESSEIVQGLLELPVELLVSVSGYCTQKDIKRLCETCRMLRDAYVRCLYHCLTSLTNANNKIQTPELYRAIDLSSHNAEVACTTRGSPSRYNSDERLPPDFVAREWTPLDYVTFRKQQLLIQTILQKPDLGKYVRELCWTVLDTNSHSWRWYIQDEETYEYNGDWPDDVEPEKYEPEDGKDKFHLQHGNGDSVLIQRQSPCGAHSRPSQMSRKLTSVGSGESHHIVPLNCANRSLKALARSHTRTATFLLCDIRPSQWVYDILVRRKHLIAVEFSSPECGSQQPSHMVCNLQTSFSRQPHCRPRKLGR